MPKMIAQVPKIGWRVHYVSRGSKDGVFVPECRPAIIYKVHNVMDGAPYDLGLVIYNENGQHWNHVTEFDLENAPGTWHWPGDYGGDCEA